MENILLSIVVPCYNEINYIEDCVNSISNQDLKCEFEIIVVDGLSTDGTRNIIYNLMEKFPNLRLVDNEKRITPVALNLGIKASRGNYVAILGAHTIYEKNYLSKCLEMFEKHPDISCAGGPIHSSGKTDFAKAAALAMSNLIGVGNATHRFPDYEGYARAACFPVFKKEIFDEVGFYDEKLIHSHDDELYYRISKAEKKVYLTSQAKCSYFVRNTPQTLFKQYFNYGVWRISVFNKHHSFIAWRRTIPIAFYIAMILLFAIGISFSFPYNIIAFILPAIYFGIISLFGISKSVDNGIKVGINFMLAVFILHLSYASGCAAGIVKQNRKQKKFNPKFETEKAFKDI